MFQLEVKSLSKRFAGSPVVLDSINFAVSPGEFLVILGASGCGKTTLLRIIAGLETPDSGQVLIAGRDVTRLEPKERDVAMVFQNYALYPHMTVSENLAFALKIRKLPREQINQKVAQTANLIGLEPHLDKHPRQLSGGQRQRVALGRAIIRNPALFLFDEPLSNLDAELRMKMRSELLALHRRVGGTSLYVTHDQVEAMSLADRIIILNRGKQIGPERPRILYDTPPDIFVAGFLGNPGMNLIRGIFDPIDHKIRLGDKVAIDWKSKPSPATEIYYGFRPEDCNLSDNGVIPATVIGHEDSGKEYIVGLEGHSRQKMFCLSQTKPQLGAAVRLTVKRAYLFDSNTGKLIYSD